MLGLTDKQKAFAFPALPFSREAEQDHDLFRSDPLDEPSQGTRVHRSIDNDRNYSTGGNGGHRFWLRADVLSWLSRHREEGYLIILIGSYSLIFSILTIARMNVLQSSAWDLGNYNQAMFTFTHDGLLFYWTSDIPQNPGGSLFGSHFSPFFALLSPAYFFFPRPETLLVIQSVAIALGALPVWLFARNIARVNSSTFRLTLASIYLLQPASLGLNWFDFHPEAFIPVFYLLAAYFLIRRRFVLGILFSVLLLSTIEYAPLLLITLCAILAWSEVRNKGPPQGLVSFVTKLSPWIAIACVSFGWLYLSLFTIRSFNPADPTTSGVTSNWTVLGANNLIQVPVRAVLDPIRAGNALLFDANIKFAFLLILGLPFALMPLASVRFWILSSPWLIPALLSNTPGYYTIGLQYAAFVFPPLVLSFLLQLRNWPPTIQACIESLLSKMANLREKLTFFTVKVDLRVLLISTALIALALSNPIASFSTATSQWANYGAPLPTAKSLAANNLLELVPGNASILTDYYIFPLVSSRLNAFTWPYVINYPTIPFPTYIESLVTKSTYILVDLDTFLPYVAITLGYAKSAFGVLGYSDNLLLLERNYGGSPIVFQPFARVFDYQELKQLSGRVIDDSSSTFGRAMIRYGNETTSDFWSGPGALLPPGIYTVDFRLKVTSPFYGHVLNLSIVTHELEVDYNITQVGNAKYQEFAFSKPAASERVLSSDSLNSTNLQLGLYTDITQTLRLDTLSVYDFTGTNASSATIFLDRVQISEISPLTSYSSVRIANQNGTVSVIGT